MKGAILAGGLGTRLYPLTHATNKHLLPIYDQPMIFYPIQTLVRAGIKEIMVVTGGPHAGDFIQVLKNGEELNLNLKHLEYAYQENPLGGIADALSFCEDFADKDSLCVILGDNCTDANIKKEVQSFKKGAKTFLKEVPDPQRFGVAVFSAKGGSASGRKIKNQKSQPKAGPPRAEKCKNQNEITPQTHRIIKIEEKPKKPKSNLAVTGLYIYDKKVFDYIRKIKPSDRGQLEITDVNNLYIKAKKLDWAILDGFWSDAGTFETLFGTSKYWAEKKLK